MKSSKDNVKNKEFDGFPLEHYSYSSFTKFSMNPYMFKVNNINGDYLEVTTKPSTVLGRACHKALETYYTKSEITDDGEKIKEAHNTGVEFLKSFSEDLIDYSSTISNRAALNDKYAFAFFTYLKEINLKNDIKEILLVEKMLVHKVEVDGVELPIPLKGSADVVYRDMEDRIIIRDHKFTSRFSPEEEIDGAKLLQAAFNYFLIYAELGEQPYSMIYEEVKITENRNKTERQVKEFEIVFKDQPLIFDFFFRFYEDVTNALLGKQVFVPNLMTFFDKEVSILAYIHKLDIDEEREKSFKKLKVTNISDFLKKKIQTDGAMKKYLETVSQKFISGDTLNYKTMTIEDRIKMKLAEHGLGVEFDSKVVGGSVVLYRYEPSIGLKMTRIESFVKDIEQVVEVSDIRVLAPIRDSGLVGFEVPNTNRTFPKNKPLSAGFNLAIGVDIMGEVKYYDIRTAPHMLVAGSSGSGKSVFLNALIKQLQKLSDIELHLFDPKQVELFQFEGKKNITEYQHDHAQIAKSLEDLVKIMEERYVELRKARVKNINGLSSMPYKFIIIDEFADLTMKSEVSRNIQLLAQKGRACGIHLIIATQRASTKVISGDIKVNFPTRAVFKMSKRADSQVMLDESGAEKLLGKGDMLFASDRGIDRLQGFLA